MERGQTQLLFALLRSAAGGAALTEGERAMVSEDMLEGLLLVAEKHDVVPLVAAGLPREDNPLGTELFKAAYRYETLNYDFEKICGALEEEGIPFLPLKGSVLRKLYPKPWMRTSCDIDILVQEERVEQAASCLVDKLGCTAGGKMGHDIQIRTAARTALELHYTLAAEGDSGAAAEILRTVWDRATVREGTHCWYEMPDELFYFYHIAHMAKHFVEGGCGVRPFLDLWLLNRMTQADQTRRETLLKRGGLWSFAERASALTEVWFGEGEMDPVSQQMERYILQGGVYGTVTNRVLVQQNLKGGKAAYIRSRIFLPYDSLKFCYPVLQRHQWLTPVMQVHRWSNLIFKKRGKRAVQEWRYSSVVSDAETMQIQSLIEALGL